MWEPILGGGDLIIPEGVTTLTRNFLGGDSVRHSLTRVVLPDSLQKIEGPAEPYDGIGAFSGCKNLIEVIFPNHKVEVACRMRTCQWTRRIGKYLQNIWLRS